MSIFKGILCDLDNTLYNYHDAHTAGLDAVIQFMKTEFSCSSQETTTAFNCARKEIKESLVNTAASHHRLLYLQRMLELLSINPLPHALILYDTYWENFLNHINPLDGVVSFFQAQSKIMPICIVTNLTAHIQYRKLHTLGLIPFISHLVTSEEIGKEKPHPDIFQLALQKINLKTNEVCMIGDNYLDDIVGATNLGIKAFWLNTTKNSIQLKEEKSVCFSSFSELNLGNFNDERYQKTL